MSIAVSLVALLLKVAGALFLLAAAIGLVRFKDALQRMHAATKAGTIGAGLVVAGTLCTMRDTEGIVIGVLAILLLFLTAPVAGHLLGRAAYLSETEHVGIEGRDALKGMLEKKGSRRSCLPGAALPQDTVPVSVPRLESIRFYVVPPHDTTFVARVLNLARDNHASVEACAVINPDQLVHAGVSDWRLVEYKGKLADAVAATQEQFARQGTRFSLLYLEGHVEDFLPARPDQGQLLVLPARDRAAWMALASRHAGPVLCVCDRMPGAAITTVAILDDGSEQLLAWILWAVQHALWTRPNLHIIEPATPQRMADIDQALHRHGFKPRVAGLHAAHLPALSSGYDAVVCTQDCYWLHAPANPWPGEVLIVPRR